MRKLERFMENVTCEELCDFMCGKPEENTPLYEEYYMEDTTLDDITDLMILKELGLI